MSEPDSHRPPKRQIEREFGVPIAGEILPTPAWTQTALKELPDGPIDFPALFGREAPVMLDLGCGNARYTLHSAVWRPTWDHLATDILPVVIRYAIRRGNQRGLKNVRFHTIGARELLERHIGPHTVQEVHCYHPQPYYLPHEMRRRLINPEFLRLVHRALKPGGLFVIQTDHPAYWEYMFQIIPEFFTLTPHPGRWADAPKGRTRREIIALRAELPIFRATAVPRADLTDEALDELVSKLPKPLFNADRNLDPRLARVDHLERRSSRD